LAFIAGSPDRSASKKKAQRRILFNALAFVIGFSIVFILLGASAGFIGSLLGTWRDSLGRVAGAVIIVFGLTMLGILRLPVLSRDSHFHPPHFITLGRWESSFLIGVLFALGWSPCIGPVLGTILLLASGSSTVLEGAFLLLIFSIGLGLPFILTALAMGRAQDLFSGWGTISNWLTKIGGVVLISIGFLMLVGEMPLLVEWGSQLLNGPYTTLLKYM
jgi:cytochrome c-type biogenesis protein